MATQVISFRLNELEISLLQQHADSEDESVNAITQRLLREVLGVSTESSTGVDGFSERVQAIVDARIEAVLSSDVDNRIQARIQEEMATILGECSA